MKTKKQHNENQKVYVISPHWSGIAGPFADELEATEYAEEQSGETISRKQIDPEHPVLKKKHLYDN